MEYIQMFLDFITWTVSNVGWFIFIPICASICIMFLLNLILKRASKNKSVLDLDTLRKSFEFIISFPLTYGIYCVTVLALKVEADFLDQLLPGIVVLGLAVQMLYLVLNRCLLFVIKFVINTIKNSKSK